MPLLLESSEPAELERTTFRWLPLILLLLLLEKEVFLVWLLLWKVSRRSGEGGLEEEEEEVRKKDKRPLLPEEDSELSLLFLPRREVDAGGGVSRWLRPLIGLARSRSSLVLLLKGDRGI